VVPTILEGTGIPPPDMIDGIGQKPMVGVSMVYTWDKTNANVPSKRDTQYFEMLGNGRSTTMARSARPLLQTYLGN